MNFLPALVAIATLLPSTGAAKNDEKKPEFPHRKQYTELPYITTADFLAIQNPVIVDARNAAEYNVIHAVSALNMPVEKMEKKDLDGLRKAHPDQTIVFYCNGNTCSKSYKAGEKARIWGLENYFVFDSGIFTFATAAPERTEFFGKIYKGKELAKQLLSKEDLTKHCVEPKLFIDMMRSGEFNVYDVRDKKERQDAPIKVGKLAKIDMDQFVAFLAKDKVPTDKVLIFDNSGKQIKWLQYYLEQHGVEGYTFMTGGVGQWIDEGYDAEGNFSGAVANR